MMSYFYQASDFYTTLALKPKAGNQYRNLLLALAVDESVIVYNLYH